MDVARTNWGLANMPLLWHHIKQQERFLPHEQRRRRALKINRVAETLTYPSFESSVCVFTPLSDLYVHSKSLIRR